MVASKRGGSLQGEMKRADRRSSINILVLGDEAVGKSSLISTFVSRYFSQDVPGIMTRVRLPPDPENSSVTTIIDSQGGDAALISAVAALSLRSGGSSTESLENLVQRAEASLSSSPARPTSSSAPLAAAATSVLSPEQGRMSTTGITTATATTPTPSGGGGAGTMTTSSASVGGVTGAGAAAVQNYAAAAAATGMEHVDSIVLVYDLDRVETFFRLERHWLPLIQRCYNGKVPVIVAENKMDLFRPSTSAGMTDEQALARKRQQIVSLMQQFPFVRQCIKCSAKNLLRVDDVFLKAQQAVLYPFTPPLYDLETGRLTVECKRAFTRIFRMYDRDHDSLLSDSELDRFQRETYHVPVFDRDFAAWKKVVTRNSLADNETEGPVIQDGKFTVAGFLAIFDVFINQNRLDVVWQALRKFGYDDDLNLHVPESVLLSGHGGGGGGGSTRVTGSSRGVGESKYHHGDEPVSDWKLSSAAKKFLVALFHQFDSNQDGCLSQEDIRSMFSILAPPSLPPWHPSRAPELFDGCFSMPKASPSRSSGASSTTTPSGGDMAAATAGAGGADESLIVPAASSSALSLSQSGFSILSANDSLPSIDVGGMHSLTKKSSLTFLEWMGHWHAVAAISPAVARAELFRLGHVEAERGGRKSRRSRKKRSVPSFSSSGRHKSSSGAAGTGSGMTAAEEPKTAVYRLPESALKSRETRVLVLGSQASGKTALLNALCGAYDDGIMDVQAMDTTPTNRPETSTTFVKLRKRVVSTTRSTGSVSGTSGATTGSAKDASSSGGKQQQQPPEEEGEEIVMHLVFTDVPEAAAASQEEHYRELTELFGATTSPKDRACDVAMLVFDSTQLSSWMYTKELESTLLTNETPRVFVATKTDLLGAGGESSSKSEEGRDDDEKEKEPAAASAAASSPVLEAAEVHCKELDLENPLLTTATMADAGESGREERNKILDHLARCALCEPGIDRLRSRPHEEQKRREAARRRKMMWLGGIVSVGVVVAVGMGLLWRGSAKKDQKASSGGSFGWLRSWFGGGTTTADRTA